MIYTIKKGHHSCSPLKIKLCAPIPMFGTFVLTPEMWYDTAVEGTHINKLVGLSTDIFNDNSLRLGWRPSEDGLKFDIYVYIHLGGSWVRSPKLKDDIVLTVHASVEYSWSIYPSYDNDEDINIARFVVGGSAIDRAYDVNMGSGWFRQFYYGGRPTATKTMTANIYVEGYV